MSDNPHALFICTGNAGRSQMAEALLRRLAGDRVRVSSAGVHPWDHLHPVAVRLLAARGMDLAGHAPKHVRVWADTPMDLVVTIGDRARDLTPELPGNPRRMHWDVPDPADFDRAGTARQEEAFRQALADIERRMPEALALLLDQASSRALHLQPGISTCFARPAPFAPRSHFPLLARAGFRCVELNGYLGGRDFAWDDPAALREAAAIAKDCGVAICSLHAVGDWLVHEDPRRTRMMIDLAKASMDAAVLLGAAVVAIHAGLPPELPRESAEAALRAALAELEAHALPMPCRFGWENEARGLTAEEHLRWMHACNPGAIGLVLDTGHSNISGATGAYLAGARLRLLGLHVNDNDGQHDLHQLPGRGTGDWPRFIPALHAAGYIGPLMLEALEFGGTPDTTSALEAARRSLEWLTAGAAPSARAPR